MGAVAYSKISFALKISIRITPQKILDLDIKGKLQIEDYLLDVMMVVRPFLAFLEFARVVRSSVLLDESLSESS